MTAPDLKAPEAEPTVALPEAHPAADLFPAMPEEEFQKLKADIAEHGQREPAWTLGGQILDGRHRARACAELGIKLRDRAVERQPWYRPGQFEPIAFVASLNLQRRHLDATDRALIAAEICKRLEAAAKERQRAAGGDKRSPKARTADGPSEPSEAPTEGENPPSRPQESLVFPRTQAVEADVGRPLDPEGASVAPGRATAQAAELTDVSESSVRRGKKVLEKGTPKLQQALRDKQIPLAKADEIARRPPEEQDAAVDATIRARTNPPDDAGIKTAKRAIALIEELGAVAIDDAIEQLPELVRVSRWDATNVRDLLGAARAVRDGARDFVTAVERLHASSGGAA